MTTSGQWHHNSILLASTSTLPWVHRALRNETAFQHQLQQTKECHHSIPCKVKMVTILKIKKNSGTHWRTVFRKPSANMNWRSSASRHSRELLGEEALWYSLDPKCPQSSPLFFFLAVLGGGGTFRDGTSRKSLAHMDHSIGGDCGASPFLPLWINWESWLSRKISLAWLWLLGVFIDSWWGWSGVDEGEPRVPVTEAWELFSVLW